METALKKLARYEPDTVYIGTGEYMAECVRDDDGEYYLAEDVDAIIEELQAECEKLRKDAERYRWLRDKCDRWDGGLIVAKVTEFSMSSWSGDDLDGAVDEAMNGE